MLLGSPLPDHFEQLLRAATLNRNGRGVSRRSFLCVAIVFVSEF